MSALAQLFESNSLVWALAQNAALLIALIYIHSLFPLAPDSARLTRFTREASLGLILGLLGILVIAVAHTFEPGVVFDTRSILISLTGLFFGVIPAVIVMALTATFRLFQGGGAAPVGVAVILASGLIGLTWRRVRKPDLMAISWRELLVFGTVVHVVMIGIFATVPTLFPKAAFSAVALPVLIIYPLVTVILGRLLASSFENRANSERLQLIFKGANDGWWDWDLHSNVLVYSPRWWQMLGLEPDSLPVHANLWRELMHPDDLERVNQRFGAILAGGDKQYEIEFRLRHREGHFISVMSRGYIQHDAAGKPVRVSGANLDITSLRRALEEANAAKFWMESAGRIARIGYWEIYFDGSPPMWSDLTCDIHEVPRGFVPTLAQALDFYPDEYREAIFTDVENLRLHGRSFNGEHQIVTAKGRRIWVQSRAEPIFDGGRVMAARGVFQDIDAQKRAAEALAQSDRNYRAIFDATGDAIMIHDACNGRILDVNLAMIRMYGFPDKAAALAFNLDELCLGEAPYGPEDERRHIQAALKEGPQVFEWHTRRADRSTFWVEVSLRRTEIGGQGRLLACCRDITHRKALEARMREADKMGSLGRLAGGIAHDFNNMLGVIIGHTDLAEIHLKSGQDPRDDLTQIRSAAQRSAALVRQLLTFARQQDTSPAVIDLNRAVQGALSLLRRLIGEHIALSWFPGPDLWPIKIDPVQIDQILTNLAVNARDATQDNGSITVRTFNEFVDDAERVVIEFSDSGSGMDAETIKHVFEPFFTTKAVGKGTGLGLATVYGIVEQNHGSIEVESRLQHGTTFRIRFPRAKEGVSSFSDAAESSPMPVPAGSETILLVEDEPAILELATMVLELKGYRIVPVSTPEAALAFVAGDKSPLHLVISDVIMPGLNGRALRQQILAQRPGLKFLFMSGYSGDILGDLDLSDPSVGFLGKPFAVDEFAAKVRECLDR